ncbi:MAG TPA: glycosyltransferase family 2 protein [Ilumatobacteraceae bacterium]|nr:glycosyltransferase family 2 protein [Ilumatobacteraceae bacterium]
MTKLIIQIPCLNEEATLPTTIADLPREVAGFDEVEWLVIDDGSTDRTVEVARECGVQHVVSHGRNRGLAAAFLTGLDAALRAGADVIVNTDADNQYQGSYIGALTAPVLDGSADIVVGERPIESIEEFSFIKKVLQRFGTWVVRRFSGTPVRDAASGFRAFNREAAIRLRVHNKYTYTMETLIQAGAERLRVVSVPIQVNPETRPSRLVKSSLSYVLRSMKTIVRSYAIYRPFRFFTIAAAVPGLLGTALLARWIYYFATDEVYHPRLPNLLGGVVLIVIAGQVMVIAFLGDVVAATRRTVEEETLARRRQELGSR